MQIHTLVVSRGAPDNHGPLLVEQTEMQYLGHGHRELRDACRTEIAWHVNWHRRCPPDIGECDPRRVTAIMSNQQIFLVVGCVDVADHIDGRAAIAKLTNRLAANV